MKENKIILSAIKYDGNMNSKIDTEVCVEEPLEIFIDGKFCYMTMRLPGEEVPLAFGYCFFEGIIASANDVLAALYCSKGSGNRIEITLSPGRRKVLGAIESNRFPSYSGRGTCSGNTDDAMLKDLKRKSSLTIKASEIGAMHEALWKSQKLFLSTGGTHAAAVFDGSLSLMSFGEDTGRHNAFDKAAGILVAESRIKDAAAVLMTSRLSYEIVRRAAITGIEILIGISAPTTLAIELAKKANITLIGFSRNGSGNIYSAAERILF